MDIVALTTCHNRCELTLAALHTLRQQKLPSDCTLRVCVVDDGSTDGTADIVTASFPDVRVVVGPGNLYWAGGMRYGWNEYARERSLDYLLVFNDDIALYETAVATLLRVAADLESEGCRAYAVSGALVDPESNLVAYGGAVNSSWWHPLRFRTITPSDCAQHCDTINMNFTLISRAALDLTGFLSVEYQHARADYDFGLRLGKLGGRLMLAPGYVGSCRAHPLIGTSLERGAPGPLRWKRLISIKEEPPGERAVFYRRHAGLVWPLYWALPYLRIGIQAMRYAVGSLSQLIPGFEKKKRDITEES